MGKPILIGFELIYSTDMNAASAGNSANYQVEWTSVSRVKKKKVDVFHSVPISVSYNAVTHSATLNLAGKQAFVQGGQIIVNATAPNGVTSALDALLDGDNEGIAGDNATFKILPKGKSVTR